ncbi:3-ketoacyl-CoA synthase 11 [Physcomitrium patens]|uniref:3-ketoacyl-CoA synthase n=1 Tax=Physcomitrium patens TaxID=3218 RepID=A0A2K1JS55_PHYPA|nr:3-ketoacyl-CoA synthase 11-like [Physcomitrium patens]PNR44296.1 hypothetical protein PHYPA_016680 [Physcomitrium patens]|eukprot:XP_024390354.1 3-ketoacyl-CoA synthase 11-like [Physcomitrella patens]
MRAENGHTAGAVERRDGPNCSPHGPEPSISVKVGTMLVLALRDVQSLKLKIELRGLAKSVTIQNLVCAPFLLVFILTAVESDQLWHTRSLQTFLWERLWCCSLFKVLVYFGGIVLATTLYFLYHPRRVYMLDFACHKPHEKNAISKQGLLNYAGSSGLLSDKSLDFMRKILERSGLGDSTYVPAAITSTPADRSMVAAREEAATNMFCSLDELFAKTGVNSKDVKILVVNSSVFCPTPSLSAMVVNRYKMRSDIKSINVSGMGCSAGLIAIDLAKDLLHGCYRNSYAIVCSQEILCRNSYCGNDRAKLVSNCLFRMGGAAVLLSNRSRDRWRAKYELMHTVRTHTGPNDKCYQCVVEEEDEEGRIGVTLSKDLMSVAGEALKINISTLGPLVLPWMEQLQFIISMVGRKVFKTNTKPYIPDFKTAFEHFCIHAGGRAVLDEVEKNLHLTEWHMEPSRMTLYRFGNTSSSSLWYELAYCEAKGRVKKGDRIWQIAFGSGFKCNSAVWRALRTIAPPALNPWDGIIDQYPVKGVSVPCELVFPLQSAASAGTSERQSVGRDLSNP